MKRMHDMGLFGRVALAVSILSLGLLACPGEGANDDAGKTDAALVDAANSDTTGTDTIGTDAFRNDASAAAPGEVCENAHVVSWQAPTIVVNGDTSTAANDYTFSSCLGASWNYPNGDLIYRLDFPSGKYLITLRHDYDYSFLSVLFVQTNSPCANFADSCMSMDDADPFHTVLRLIVDVDDSKQNYLAIDSAGDPSQCEPGMCAAPFELTIEKVAPQGLGNACGNWWDCADQMACFRFDEDQAQGYCTDLCGTVNCADASIPMQCRDISDGSRWPDGSEACVATSEIGTQTEYDVCDYNYGCEPFKCIASNAYDLDWGECRRPCDGSCSNANESCLDVTENMFEPPPSGQSQYICVPNSDIATKVQNDPCMYSYECQAGLYCEIDTCESR